MKTLFYLCNAMMFVLALVACGGDEPVPVGPDQPTEDTTEVVDTIPTDTVVEDTTEEDTLEVYFQQINPRYFVESNLEWTEYLFNGWSKNKPQYNGTNFIYDESMPINSMECGHEGYVTQRVEFQWALSRTLTFTLLQNPERGTPVTDITYSQEALTVSNEVRNQEETGIKAELLLHGGTKVDNADSTSCIMPVAYMPALSNLGMDMPPANTMLYGAIGGLTILPVTGTLDRDGQARVTLPYLLEGQKIKARSPDGWEIPVTAEGQTAVFDLPVLGDWHIEMEARVVSVTMEWDYLAQNLILETPPGVPITMIGNLYTESFDRRVGFEAESNLRPLEERYLTSLFGRKETYIDLTHGDLTKIRATLLYNHLCRIVYDVWQEVYHLTFEAAGHRFQAKVYGEPHFEIIEATRKTIYDN